ncbi:MAG: serine hydrolase domain-containing protein [Planctomycetota bacterium]
MNRRTAALATMAALLAAVPVSAREDVRDVSALLTPHREAADIPGMAAAVITSKGLVARGVSGVRARGHDAKVTFEDRFHLGSCTKAMTATLIGTLVEDGKLSFDDTVGKTLGKAVGKELHADWKDVPLSLLLRNRGGAPADLRADGLWMRLWTHKGTPTEQRADLRDGVLKKAPAYPPGEKYVYSNAGFALAGHAAETVMGKPWEDLMRRRIFKPLGMKSAGFGAPGSTGKVDEPRGHRGESPVPPGPGSDNPAAIGPAGTVHASVGDWAKFIGEHLRGARGEDGLLKAKTFKVLHSPAEGEGPAYAMGWSIRKREWAKGAALVHNGSNTMWYCLTWIAPERDLAVLVAGNRMGKAQRKATDAALFALVQDELKAREK